MLDQFVDMIYEKFLSENKRGERTALQEERLKAVEAEKEAMQSTEQSINVSFPHNFSVAAAGDLVVRYGGGMDQMDRALESLMPFLTNFNSRIVTD